MGKILSKITKLCEAKPLLSVMEKTLGNVVPPTVLWTTDRQWTLHQVSDIQHLANVFFFFFLTLPIFLSFFYVFSLFLFFSLCCFLFLFLFLCFDFFFYSLCFPSLSSCIFLDFFFYFILYALLTSVLNK